MLHFDESLVCLIEDAGLGFEDVEARLAQVLLQGGWVKDSFPAALREREAAYPTALDVQGLNVAIPHCDPAHVNKGALCVGVLKHPVAWHLMDNPAATCEVSLVVMLALNAAHEHLEMLQKVVDLIQNQNKVAQVVACTSAAEAYALLAPELQ